MDGSRKRGEERSEWYGSAGVQGCKEQVGRKGDWGPGLRYKERPYGNQRPPRTLSPIMPAVRLTTRRRRSSHAIRRCCSLSLLFYSNTLSL